MAHVPKLWLCFINKVLLKHSIPVHLIIVYDCFCATTVKLNSWNRDFITIWPSQEKSANFISGAWTLNHYATFPLLLQLMLRFSVCCYYGVSEVLVLSCIPFVQVNTHY